MAHLKPDGTDGDRPGGDAASAEREQRADRGQLILVTGLAIALVIVVLVVLLNTAIYTGNLATRGSATNGVEVMGYESTVVDGVGGIVDRENRAEYDTRSALEANVSTGIENYTRLLARHRIENGVATGVSAVTLQEGTLLRQPERTRNMTSAGGSANWTLATGVDDTRNHRLTVTGGLTNTGDPTNESFRITLDGSDQWHLFVYRDGGGTLRIAVQNASAASPTTVCPGVYADTPVRLDLTAGTVNGTSCPGLVYGQGVTSSYDIEHRFGTRSTGAYNLTVNTTSGVQSSNFNAPPTSPYEVPAVYSVTLNVSYRSPEISYERRVRIAPGEADA